jgi:hypothetical protein
LLERATLGQKKLYMWYNRITVKESATMHMMPVFKRREGTW